MSLFHAVPGPARPCVLFESTSTEGPLSRQSLLARSPKALLVARRGQTRLATAAGVDTRVEGAIAGVRRLLAQVPRGSWPQEGGVAGLLAYDWARPGREEAPTPLLVAMAVDRFGVEDASGVLAEPPPAEEPAPPLSALLAEIAPGGRAARPPALPLELPRWSSLTRERYLELVLRLKEHIARGDIYQANLSQRFRLPWHRSGLDLYARLREASPAPFSGYLRAGGLEVASASPERLLLVHEGQAATRPIAGTRPRSADPEDDRALAAELLLSEKERAEHLMLVDLARNDLGKVAAIGSVHVDELMLVEDYSHVRHIVSNVRARLAPGRDALDALVALFPGGTITGVPKKRCMEILDGCEPVPRGYYTGALFYATPSGRLDANILIRSAFVLPGQVSFHTGGGIVADSDPEHEYLETLHKAEGLRVALEAVLRSGPCPS